MKKIFLVFIMSCLAIGMIQAAIIPIPVKGPIDPVSSLSTLSIKEIQVLTGRKLSLKEKVSIKIFQWKLKKGSLTRKKEGKDNTSTIALICGIAGIAFLLGIAFVGLFPAAAATVLALILGYKAKRKNPEDKKAKWAIILGWISVGLFVAFTIIAIAVLSGLRWG
jgi:hypothetical protein